MAAVVADTHSVLWSLLQSKKLSANALATFNQATLLGDPIYVASISVVETRYLEEKGKLQQGTLARLTSALEGNDSGLVLVPLDLGVAEAVGQVPREAVPDMPETGSSPRRHSIWTSHSSLEMGRSKRQGSRLSGNAQLILMVRSF